MFSYLTCSLETETPKSSLTSCFVSSTIFPHYFWGEWQKVLTYASVIVTQDTCDQYWTNCIGHTGK